MPYSTRYSTDLFFKDKVKKNTIVGFVMKRKTRHLTTDSTEERIGSKNNQITISWNDLEVLNCDHFQAVGVRIVEKRLS